MELILKKLSQHENTPAGKTSSSRALIYIS